MACDVMITSLLRHNCQNYCFLKLLLIKSPRLARHMYQARCFETLIKLLLLLLYSKVVTPSQISARSSLSVLVSPVKNPYEFIKLSSSILHLTIQSESTTVYLFKTLLIGPNKHFGNIMHTYILTTECEEGIEKPFDRVLIDIIIMILSDIYKNLNFVLMCKDHS